MLSEKEVLESLALFKTALHKLKDQNASLKESYDSLKTQFDEQSLTSQKTAEQTAQKISNFQEIITTYEQHISDFRTKTFQTIKYLVENNIEVKEQQIKELEDKCTNLEKRVNDTDNMAENLNQLSALRAQLVADNNSLVTSNNSKDIEIEQLQEELRLKKYTEEDLANALAQQKQELEAQQPTVNEFLAQESYERKIAQLEGELKNQIAKYNELITEKDELLSRVKGLSGPVRTIPNPMQTPPRRPDSVLNDPNQSVYYMFGHATEKIKNQLVSFITELYNGVDDTHSPYQLISIETAALRAQISDKTRNVFIKRLYEMTSNGQHLIYDKDGHICSDFTRDYIIEYVTRLNSAAY